MLNIKSRKFVNINAVCELPNNGIKYIKVRSTTSLQVFAKQSKRFTGLKGYLPFGEHFFESKIEHM
jgi:Mor family transcriptional regulator